MFDEDNGINISENDEDNEIEFWNPLSCKLCKSEENL